MACFKDNSDIAKKILNIIMEEEDFPETGSFKWYVFGFSLHSVHTISSTGEEVPDVVSIMEAIYDYYRTPETEMTNWKKTMKQFMRSLFTGKHKISAKKKDIDQLLYNIWNEGLCELHSVAIMATLLKEIVYHIECEKGGISPFSLDYRTLLEACKVNVAVSLDRCVDEKTREKSLPGIVLQKKRIEMETGINILEVFEDVHDGKKKDVIDFWNAVGSYGDGECCLCHRSKEELQAQGIRLSRNFSFMEDCGASSEAYVCANCSPEIRTMLTDLYESATDT